MLDSQQHAAAGHTTYEAQPPRKRPRTALQAPDPTIVPHFLRQQATHSPFNASRTGQHEFVSHPPPQSVSVTPQYESPWQQSLPQASHNVDQQDSYRAHRQPSAQQVHQWDASCAMPMHRLQPAPPQNAPVYPPQWQPVSSGYWQQLHNEVAEFARRCSPTREVVQVV